MPAVVRHFGEAMGKGNTMNRNHQDHPEWLMRDLLAKVHREVTGSTDDRTPDGQTIEYTAGPNRQRATITDRHELTGPERMMIADHLRTAFGVQASTGMIGAWFHALITDPDAVTVSVSITRKATATTE